MNQPLLAGTAEQRVLAAIDALKLGQGVLLVDDEDRENEGDIVYAAQSITKEQMALLIRHGSGIVCLCLTHERADALALPPMVDHNSSQNGTAFTVSIEAKVGVTTGVSAADRVTTIRTAVADHCQPGDLARPGHVFPLRANPGGVLSRRGHTEGSVELMQLAGLKPAGVICEVAHDDGDMMRLPELVKFAKAHQMPLLSIEDIVQHLALQQRQSA
ncbi:3,4-dihydroxy-2-butanone-4-phosphate synthase [Ferrimonas sp. SCSIO 43195]|uniref:3,4-dihydroxy-2-butanone-4-phosphate synthase n=1 Tax=Ferrimonas sp. SCSIO 43195 TaxID=2822844 RepID=UPI002074B894|nr:3,4-dihydroxy-2-butanone-4-phosphate synthase [Ferrimonas sp. SCSIO 43195]USD36372.1 3,4-dihydroxy-2-butanone-4-phosphate synthase [Ferrimonas sp. SCSIO 43195]